MENSVQPVKILLEQLKELAQGAVALIPNLTAAIIMLGLTWLLSVLIGKGLFRTLKSSGLRPSLKTAVVKLAKVGVWIVGTLVAAMLLFPGLTPTKLLAGLGIGSIAIGLAFKDTFENFLAGFLILLRKPMRIGDDIECEDLSGQVEDISIRDTMLRKRSGELILVPNSFLFKNPVTVVTDLDHRRISVVVGVAYGEDADAARQVILSTVEKLTSRNTSKDVEVFAVAFGASSIDFLVRWWAESTPGAEHKSRCEAVIAIKQALDDAGIEIPFPYRTLTFAEPLEIRKSEGT